LPYFAKFIDEQTSQNLYINREVKMARNKYPEETINRILDVSLKLF